MKRVTQKGAKKGHHTNGSKVALIYCRVSTQKQEDEGTSLDSQAAACVAHAEKLGYCVGRVTKEVYSGAELFDRPKLSLDRADIRAGIFQAVVVYAIDRLSRNVAHLAILSDEFERAGARLIFVTEELDDTPEGKLLQSVRGYVAEVERQKIRERCVRGKRQKALNGKVLRGGTDLYGYSYDAERSVRVVKEDEARIVRQMFQWILEGISTRKIIQRLNEQGVPSPGQGKRAFKDGRRPYWGKGAVGRILSDPAYKGVGIAWRFKGVSGFENGKKFNRIVERERSEWIELPEGTTPAVVSPEVWEAVQQRLRTNRGDETRNLTRPDLLRGHIFCAVCGRRMQGQDETKGHGRRDFRVYRCSSRLAPSGACGGKRLRAGDVEEIVWGKIEAIIRNPDTVKVALEQWRKDGAGVRTQLEGELESARAAQRKAEAEYQRLISRAASIGDDEVWKDFQPIITGKKQEGDRLAGLVVEVESRLASLDADAASLTSLEEYCERVRGNLASFTFEDKRLALAAFGVKVIGNGKDYLRLDGSLPDTTAWADEVGVQPTTSC